MIINITFIGEVGTTLKSFLQSLNALLKLFWNIVGYGALALAACLGADFVAASSIGGLGLGHNN